MDSEHDIENLPVPVTVDELTDDIWEDLEGLKNPHLDIPGFKALKKEGPIHRQAFHIYLKLADTVRTDKAVAEKLEAQGGSVTAAAIGKWRKSFNWEARLDHIREDDLEREGLVSARSYTDQIKSVLSTLELSMKAFQVQVQAGEIKITPETYMKMANFALELKRELSGDPLEKDSSMIGNLAKILDGADTKILSVMVNNMKTYISQGNSPLDRDIQMKEARVMQDVIEANEIGGDGFSDYSDVDNEYIAN